MDTKNNQEHKMVCDTTKQIVKTYFDKLPKDEKLHYISEDYNLVSKIKIEEIQYYDTDEYGYFNNLEEYKLYIKQENLLDHILQTIIDDKLICYGEEKLIKKKSSNRIGVPIQKNSVQQQKKHSKNLNEMCEAINKKSNSNIRCIWKKTKEGCFCSRHSVIYKQKNDIPNINTIEDYILDPLYKCEVIEEIIEVIEEIEEPKIEEPKIEEPKKEVKKRGRKKTKP
jgi:hypothetical protein